VNARRTLINSRGLWALAIAETLAALLMLGVGLNAPVVFLFATMLALPSG